MSSELIRDHVGESTVYAVQLSGRLVITVRAYTPEAEINVGEVEPYFMSIGYLGGRKRGTIFLLSKDGFAVVKHYEYCLCKKLYQLTYQGERLETVDHLFNQFETDVASSPYLQDTDYECRTSGEFIDHDLMGLPECPREADIEKYSQQRNQLSYAEKLAQQKGRRKDPIENVLSMLHTWDNYTLNQMNIRSESRLSKFRSQKSGDMKLFSFLDDTRTDEDRYIEAQKELNRIKSQAGSMTDSDRIKIRAKLPKIREALSKKEEIEFAIEDAIDAAEPRQIDFGFREFDGIGHG